MALTLVSLFYGINYSVLKVVMPEHFDAYGFVLIRVMIAGAIFWLVYFPKREKIDWKADGLRFALCALTGVDVNMLLFYKGISFTTAVNASIIMTLTPIMVLVWASLINRERITLLKVGGILLGMTGAIIIIYEPEQLFSPDSLLGNVLVFLNGSSFALYLVMVKPLTKKYKPLTIVTYIFTIGFPLTIPMGLGRVFEVDLAHLPLGVWISIGYAIVFSTVIVYLLNAWTLVRVNASVVGSFIYLQPFFAVLVALFFFEEAFLLKHFFASTFIFGGVFLVTKQSS